MYRKESSFCNKTLNHYQRYRDSFKERRSSFWMIDDVVGDLEKWNKVFSLFILSNISEYQIDVSLGLNLKIETFISFKALLSFLNLRCIFHTVPHLFLHTHSGQSLLPFTIKNILFIRQLKDLFQFLPFLWIGEYILNTPDNK